MSDKTTTPKCRAECAQPKMAYRLMRGERIVGLALAISSGGWKVYDTDERAPLSPEHFKTPQAAAIWGQRMGLGV